MTDLALVDLSEVEARKLTNTIRQTVAVALVAIRQAYEGRAWLALGYPSWADYCTAEFGEHIRLPSDERQQAVAELSGSGMSTRAIGTALGVGVGTVHRDLAGVPNGTPEPVTVTDDHETTKPEIVDKVITGMDGKEYKLPTAPTLDRSRAGVAARVEQVRALALTGASSRQIARDIGIGVAQVKNINRQYKIDNPADRILGKGHQPDPVRIIETSIATLDGIVSSLALIEDISSFDAEKRQEWSEAFRLPLAAITRFTKELAR